MIEITLKAGRAKRDLVRLGRNIPTASKAAISEVADKFVALLQMFAPKWRGTLINSLRAEAIDWNKIVVKAIFYAWWLEKGHRLKKVTPLLAAWAREKLPRPEIYLRLVEAGYPSVSWVRSPRLEFKRPFIKPAINALRPQIHHILRKHITEGIRRSIR